MEEQLLSLIDDFQELPSEELDESVSVEGGAFLRLHQVRERDAELANRKKQRVLREAGRLACVVCAFDFKAFYGNHGEGYAEVHHTRPIGARTGAEPTSLEELAVVCANCHRMLHRHGLIDVTTLRAIVSKNGTLSTSR